MGNEQSAARHEPPLPEVVPKKSSLSRSRSVSAGMAKNKESRFLPKGLTQRRDNASASSFKNSEAVDSNGIESPQWGVSSASWTNRVETRTFVF